VDELAVLELPLDGKQVAADLDKARRRLRDHAPDELRLRLEIGN
jgi:hypothetical protein